MESIVCCLYYYSVIFLITWHWLSLFFFLSLPLSTLVQPKKKLKSVKTNSYCSSKDIKRRSKLKQMFCSLLTVAMSPSPSCDRPLNSDSNIIHVVECSIHHIFIKVMNTINKKTNLWSHFYTWRFNWLQVCYPGGNRNKSLRKWSSSSHQHKINKR